MICSNCKLPIGAGDAWTWQDDYPWGPVAVHEHCADPEDAIAAGVYSPAEDYPHGDY